MNETLRKKILALGETPTERIAEYYSTPDRCPNCQAINSLYPLLSLDPGVDKVRKCRKCAYEIFVETE